MGFEEEGWVWVLMFWILMSPRERDGSRGGTVMGFSEFASAVIFKKMDTEAAARAAAETARAHSCGQTYLDAVRTGHRLDWLADRHRILGLPQEELQAIIDLLDTDGGDGRPPKLTAILFQHAWPRLDQETRKRVKAAWPQGVYRTYGV